jgi:aspartate/methionine/tyrosine aminotransferase
MFSSRLDWNTQPNGLSRILAGKRAAGVRVLDLTESNPTEAGLDYPPEVISALADPRALLYEPQPTGLAHAREAVEAYYAGRGTPVEPGRILLTTATSDSYGYLFKLLCNPGDEILVPAPSYPLFDFLAELECVRVVHYPLAYHRRWSVDVDALRSRVGERTRAVVVVNPNNPTGSFLKQHEWSAMAALGLPVIADEVFADYGYQADPDRVESLAGKDAAPSFSLSGLSKISALPQMKLGWIVANGPESFRRQAMERLELIADTYLAVSTPIQHAAGALLAAAAPVQEQIRGRVARNLAHLRAALGEESPFRVLDVEGGWYATLEIPRIQPEERLVEDLLEHDDVLVQPGYFYDFSGDGHLVLSLLTREADFAAGLPRVLARAAG